MEAADYTETVKTSTYTMSVDGIQTSSDTQEYVVGFKRSYCVGEAIPNFHKRKKNGELLPHTSWKQGFISGTATGARQIMYNDSGHVISKANVTNYVRETDSWMLSGPDDFGFTASDHQDLIAEAAANIYTNRFDALTFLLELKDVRRMFLDIGSRFFKLSRKHKNWKSSYNLHEVSCDWLAYRYGWRPLWSDIKSLVELYQNSKNSEKRTRFCEKARRLTSYKNVWYDNNFDLYAKYGWRRNFSDEVNVSYMGCVTADIELKAVMANPIITAWEIVPYSFVVDWFITVGDALANVALATLATKYVASSGYKVTITRDVSQDMVEPFSDDLISGSSYHNQTSRTELQYVMRTPGNIPLHPHLTLRLDPYKVIDLAAMLKQLIRR